MEWETVIFSELEVSKDHFGPGGVGEGEAALPGQESLTWGNKV